MTVKVLPCVDRRPSAHETDHSFTSAGVAMRCLDWSWTRGLRLLATRCRSKAAGPGQELLGVIVSFVQIDAVASRLLAGAPAVARFRRFASRPRWAVNWPPPGTPGMRHDLRTSLCWLRQPACQAVGAGRAPSQRAVVLLTRSCQAPSFLLASEDMVNGYRQRFGRAADFDLNRTRRWRLTVYSVGVQKVPTRLMIKLPASACAAFMLLPFQCASNASRLV